MPMMPQDIDNRPDPPMAETPNTGAAPPSDGRSEPAAPAVTPDEAPPSLAPTGDPTRRRRRRRRRHRRPSVDAGGVSDTTAASVTAPTAQDASAQPAPGEASAAVPGEQRAPGDPPAGDAPRRRRRRRRRRPQSDGVQQAAGTNPNSATAAAAPEPRRDTPRPQGDRPPRHRQRRHGRERDDREREERRRGDQRGASTGNNRESRARDPRRPHHKDDARGGKHPRHGRERGEFRKKPEPKLYRLESIVDRGFEDVADPATEGATRRVDWVILKRTTADQRAARALSAIYVLRRDGSETEFAHLSAARAAVNKTIAHPEKLTLSKADHAAAKAGKK
jgi:hypothetical protein